MKKAYILQNLTRVLHRSGIAELHKLEICSLLDQVYGFLPAIRTQSFGRSYFYTSPNILTEPRHLAVACEKLTDPLMVIAINSHLSYLTRRAAVCPAT